MAHVQTMLALVEGGSIRAAAELVGKTQSTLTKQLQQMEEELGLSLFQRNAKGISPTDAGLSLLARARSIDAEFKRFNQEAAHLRGEQTGTLSVSVAPLVAVKILARSLARFHTKFPDIDVAISSSLFGDALKALREGVHDIIVGPHGAEGNQNDLASEELFSTEMVLITSRKAKHANAASLGELLDCNWAMMGDKTGLPRRRFLNQFSRLDLEPPRIRWASESRSGVLAVVEEMDAVCSYPKRLLEETPNRENIVQIPIKETLTPLKIHMLTRAGQSLTPAGEEFANCIRHRVGVVVREWDGNALKA